jgi:hypothetical protein
VEIGAFGQVVDFDQVRRVTEMSECSMEDWASLIYQYRLQKEDIPDSPSASLSGTINTDNLLSTLVVSAEYDGSLGTAYISRMNRLASSILSLGAGHSAHSCFTSTKSGEDELDLLRLFTGADISTTPKIEIWASLVDALLIDRFTGVDIVLAALIVCNMDM